MLSARAGEESRVEGIEAGADDYVVKPFTARELLARVNAHLAMAKLRRDAAARERELLEQTTIEKNRLQELFRQAPAAVIVLRGPEHRISLINEGYLRILDRKAEDVLNKTVLEVLPELRDQVFIRLLDDVLRTGVPYIGVEEHAKLARGSDRTLQDAYFNFVYQPWRGSDGKIEGVFAQALDVTEQVLARKAVERLAASLQRSEGRLRAILQQVVSGIFQTDLTGRFMFVNDRFYEMTGRSAEELLQLNISELMHSEELDHSRELFEQFAATGATYEFVQRIRRPDGGEIWVQNNWSAVLDESGNPESALCVTQDITERKRTEEALPRTEKLAAVGQLASTIAHEINNPLEAVTNLHYLIQGSADIAEIKGYTKMASEELMRVSHVVTTTLRFNRGAVQRTAEKISSLLESAVALYQARLSSSGTAIERRYKDVCALECFGPELRQVFANLVGNAYDAVRASDRRRLLLRSADATDWRTGEAGVRVVVADTGHGMTKETIERLFEPFFTTKGIGGTGLGLWVSRDILNKHDARISIRSSTRAGCSGTVFSLFFPCSHRTDSR